MKINESHQRWKNLQATWHLGVPNRSKPGGCQVPQPTCFQEQMSRRIWLARWLIQDSIELASFCFRLPGLVCILSSQVPQPTCFWLYWLEWHWHQNTFPGLRSLFFIRPTLVHRNTGSRQSRLQTFCLWKRSDRRWHHKVEALYQISFDNEFHWNWRNIYLRYQQSA